MVRLNDEIFKLADFKLNKANNILIFDGAIIAVFVLYPLEILVSSKFYHKCARIPQLLQVVDELQVGYTIILLTFK